MVVVVAVVLSVAELEVSLFSVVVVASVHKNYVCFVMKKVQNSMGTIKVETFFFLLHDCGTVQRKYRPIILNQVIKVELNKFFPSFVFIELLVLYLCNIDFLLQFSLAL